MAGRIEEDMEEVRIDRDLRLEDYEVGARIGTGAYGLTLDTFFHPLTTLTKAKCTICRRKTRPPHTLLANLYSKDA